MSNFPCSLSRNTTSHWMENLAFHSLLRRKMTVLPILTTSLIRFYLTLSTPKSDHFQFSPAALPEIVHHTVWRTWFFIAYSDKRWLYYQFITTLLMHLSSIDWENVPFELGSERLKVWENVLFNPFTPKSDQCQISPAAILHHTAWRTWLFIAY